MRAFVPSIAATALLALASAPSAGAVVYCVPNDAIDPSCTTGQGTATIQGALTLAGASTADADTVRVGAGDYSEPALLYNGTQVANVLTLIGAGTTQTKLTLPDTIGTKTGLTVLAPAGSTVSGLAMTIPANADSNGDIGILLQNAAGQDLLVDGATAGNARGFQLANTGSVDDSTVNLPFAASSNIAVSGGPNTAVTDSDLHANLGVRYGLVDRSRITASMAGGFLDVGSLRVLNSVIDLGANNNAVGVQIANFNNNTSPLSAVLDGVTIVGGGSNSSGVHAQADSDATVPFDEPGDNTNDGEAATATISNTVISGPTRALRVEADRGEVATVTVNHSNYNPAGSIVTNDLTPGGGVGTVSLTETNQTNLAPGFVSATDFHLAPGSPLIDIGDPAAPMGLDLDGDPRALDGTLDCFATARRDIGADERAGQGMPDCIAPDSAINGKTKVKSKKKRAKVSFTLSATEAGSSFECSLDGAVFAPCSSPYSTKAKRGAHTLSVRAIDASGNRDASPAGIAFKVTKKRATKK